MHLNFMTQEHMAWLMSNALALHRRSRLAVIFLATLTMKHTHKHLLKLLLGQLAMPTLTVVFHRLYIQPLTFAWLCKVSTLSKFFGTINFVFSVKFTTLFVWNVHLDLKSFFYPSFQILPFLWKWVTLHKFSEYVHNRLFSAQVWLSLFSLRVSMYINVRSGVNLTFYLSASSPT